jgi:hypothetical protein
VTRAVVAAVLVLAAVAAADAIRSHVPNRRAAAASPTPVVTLNSHGLIRDREGEAITRQFAQTHALRSGRAILTPEQIAAAFPAELSGPFKIRDIAVAPDGTLVVAAVRFPRGRPARGALEFWNDGRLESGFTLAATRLNGGLGFSSDGLVAVYSADGTRATLFERGGNAVANVAVRGG